MKERGKKKENKEKKCGIEFWSYQEKVTGRISEGGGQNIKNLAQQNLS